MNVPAGKKGRSQGATGAGKLSPVAKLRGICLILRYISGGNEVKPYIMATAIAAAFAMPLGAQSLEQSYASLCGESRKDSETCRTLRQALMDKLAQDGASARPAKGAAATVKPGKVGAQWRVWAPLAGKTLVDENGDIHRFEWVEKGAVLKSTRQSAQGEEVTRYELKTDGTVMVLREGRPPVAMEPSGKTSFVVLTGADGGPSERWRYSPAAAGIDIVQESLSDGKWAATGKRSSRTLASGKALAAAEAKLAEARDAAISAEWKALGRMAGKQYLVRFETGTHEDQIVSFDWVNFGRSVEMGWTNIPSGHRPRTIIFSRDTATGAITLQDSQKSPGTVTVDGQKLAILWTTEKTGRGTAFVEFAPRGTGMVQYRGRVKKDKRRDEEQFSYIDVTGIDRKKLDDAAGYALAQRKETARQQQQQQAAKANGGGGMFGKMLGGALMGAMLGGGGQSSIDLAMAGAQAAAGGGNTYDMLTSMGSVAQASAEQSKRELDATIARAQAQAEADRQRKRQEELAAAEAKAMAASAAAESRAASAAEASRLRETAAREAAAAQAEAKRQQEAETRRLAAAADKARRDEAARLAEAERNRPVEWREGIVLCEQRPNSKEWRCPGPLQVNYVVLDSPNWLNAIGMACGSSNGVRDIGVVGVYRAFGCGFGIHPTDRTYPGNIDVPAQKGVFVDNRRIFHCPKTRDAYCRNP